MNEALAIQEERPLSAVDMRKQVNLIQQIMKEVMQDKQHYGTVPGCGNKPTLLKPGAEKLMMTFRLAADPQVEDIPTDDGITVRVTCRITSQATGAFLGAGVGEASTKEEKYNWRSAVCDEEYDETPADRRREKWYKGWGKEPNRKVKQIRTNPADVANTVLKMAKKRALVDAILTVTAASDIFTQDIEDIPSENLGNGRGGNGGGRGKVDPPKKKAPDGNGAPAAGRPEVSNPDDAPSEKQLKAVFAMLTKLGYDNDEMKHEAINEHLSDVLTEPITSAKELTKGEASTLIDRLNNELNNG